MTVEETLAAAVRGRRLLQLRYGHGDAPGVRVVEPHALGLNRKDALALQAWFLRGESASHEGPGWRVYLLEHISEAEVLPEAFAHPRPGYRPGGGKTFKSMRAEV